MTAAEAGGGAKKDGGLREEGEEEDDDMALVPSGQGVGVGGEACRRALMAEARPAGAAGRG